MKTITIANHKGNYPFDSAGGIGLISAQYFY
jgi:hypothetical protein